MKAFSDGCSHCLVGNPLKIAEDVAANLVGFCRWAQRQSEDAFIRVEMVEKEIRLLLDMIRQHGEEQAEFPSSIREKSLSSCVSCPFKGPWPPQPQRIDMGEKEARGEARLAV